MTPSFEETQRPPALFTVAAFVAVLVAAAWGMFASVRLERFVWQPFIAPAFAAALFALFRMTTTVTDEDPRIVMLPIPRKTAPGRRDRALRDRYVPAVPGLRRVGLEEGRRGWAYTMRGERGARVHLLDGKTFLVGTQRPEELAAAIEGFRRGRPSGV